MYVHGVDVHEAMSWLIQDKCAGFSDNSYAIIPVELFFWLFFSSSTIILTAVLLQLSMIIMTANQRTCIIETAGQTPPATL